MKDSLKSLSQSLLSEARRAGADQADVLAVSGSSLSIEVLDSALEHAERSEGTDIGLRVLVGNRQACVSSSDLRKTAFAGLAERAVAMARVAPEDPYTGLADPADIATDADITALELADLSAAPLPENLQSDALAAESAALAVKGVSKVQASAASWGRTEIHLEATNGLSAGYARTQRSVSCVAISGRGLTMERDYCGEGRSHAADLPDPADVGRIAAERAVSRSGPVKPPTGAFPVLFDERISSSLIGHVLAAINGASIARGSSWLADALNTQVLPVGLDLVEQPLRPRISGSKPFDSEGIAAAERTIIQDGVLRSWTLDLATARQLGLQTTGNAGRGTAGPPSPSVGNVALTPSAHSREQLIAEMGEGLLVTSLIGSAINPTSGDYSRGASGFWIKNGAIGGPVNECTIAGNLKEMMLSIQPANDARPHLSRLVPSLRVEGLTIAGA